MNWLVSAGIDRLQRGLEDDEAEDLRARFRLSASPASIWPLRDRLDAGADDLGRVGAEVDDHRRQRRRVRRPAQADRRQREEEEEQLHQERRVADELHEASDQRGADPLPELQDEHTDDSDRKRDRHRQQGKLQRQQAAVQQLRPAGKDGAEIERVAQAASLSPVPPVAGRCAVLRLMTQSLVNQLVNLNLKRVKVDRMTGGTDER